MLEITNAVYQDSYRIYLEFNNGDNGIVDLEDSLWGPVFEPLKDIEKFKKLSVSKSFGTIVWENGADFAPEYLHSKLQRSSKAA